VAAQAALPAPCQLLHRRLALGEESVEHRLELALVLLPLVVELTLPVEICLGWGHMVLTQGRPSAVWGHHEESVYLPVRGDSCYGLFGNAE